MRLYCLSGHRAAALRQYEECKETLQKEFAIKPSNKTKVLVSKIQNDEYLENFVFDRDLRFSASTKLFPSIELIKGLITTQKSTTDRLFREIEIIENTIVNR